MRHRAGGAELWWTSGKSVTETETATCHCTKSEQEWKHWGVWEIQTVSVTKIWILFFQPFYILLNTLLKNSDGQVKILQIHFKKFQNLDFFLFLAIPNSESSRFSLVHVYIFHLRVHFRWISRMHSPLVISKINFPCCCVNSQLYSPRIFDVINSKCCLIDVTLFACILCKSLQHLQFRRECNLSFCTNKQNF